MLSEDVSYAEENLFNKNVKFFKEQMQELLEEVNK